MNSMPGFDQNMVMGDNNMIMGNRNSFTAGSSLNGLGSGNL